MRSIDSNETVAAPDRGGTDKQPISKALVLLLAIAVGASVANIYYIQPLLNVVRGEFGVSDTIAGLLVTCSQVGYVVGLALLVPLGDLCERRRLVSTVLVVAAAALAACAAAPTFAVLAGALVAVGALSVVAQILVPLAASLAAPQERGQVVGSVMSGLLIGILTARIVSGIVAQIGGFRLIFALASGAMLVLAIVLRRMLPRVPATEDMTYPSALRSVFELIASEPVLRQRMAIAALMMANFTVLWTSVAFLLGASPYDYGEAAIGLFGLAGVAGASIAPFAGRWSDRGRGRVALSAFLVAVLASWALLDAGATSVIALVAGIALLDLGVQGAQISNQSAIYALRPEARSRLTTAYMVAMFIGGVVGSLLAASVYGAGGWSAICVLGAGFATVAIVVWAASERVLHASRARPSESA
ncbi:MAG TPA: MFS transporter [Solirubrobacteraceae bacterium]